MRRTARWIISLSFGMCGMLAQRLPIKSYTSADGLGVGSVKRIVSDSRGFLWFCTQNGLSRFDGYEFATYNAETLGPPFGSVNDLLEVGEDYWIATNGDGVWRINVEALLDRAAFQPSAHGPGKSGLARIETYHVGSEPATNRVNVLHRDRSGAIWAGTDGGLFRIAGPDSAREFEPIALGVPSVADRLVQIWAFADDPDGGLWVGTGVGLMRMMHGGQIAKYRIHPTHGIDRVWALCLDADRRLWIGHETGLIVLALPADPAKPGAVTDLIPAGRPIRDLLTANQIFPPTKAGAVTAFEVGEHFRRDAVLAVRQVSNGGIWIGTWGHGLIAVDAGRVRVYTRVDGLPRDGAGSLGEDAGGNLWIGSIEAARLEHNGFARYEAADGIISGPISSIFRDRDGMLYVIGDRWRISEFDGRRFVGVRPNLPARFADADWRAYRSMIKDHLGDWWVATNEGLYRFGKVTRLNLLMRTRPRVYTEKNGLAQNHVTRLFEDSRGDIWIGYFAPSNAVITRWERSTGRFHSYSRADGLHESLGAVTQILGDQSGDIWILFTEGVVRWRNGVFHLFGTADGFPKRPAPGAYLDSSGRLWIPGNDGGGVIRIANPTGDKLSVRRFDRRDGLSSDRALQVMGNKDGLIYLATISGIDVLDRGAGPIRHYSPSKDFAGAMTYAALCDRDGALWFGTEQGLSRYVPNSERMLPPPIFITGLKVAGTPRPVRRLGTRERGLLELTPDQKQLNIDFTGLSFSTGDQLRYRYKLEGADSEWTLPSPQRSVTYARLAAGTYRFMVSALNSDGVESPQPASLEFRVLAPVWLRWWFLTLLGVAVMAVIFGLHRYQLGQALALERVRTRIATDLHDDIGSSLSQIAILSEVARSGGHHEHLSRIASISRELVDSMSDIVWTINPRKDSLADLIWRMRQFAGEMFVSRDIAFTFRAPSDGQDLRLGAELRRQVFLIFKECVNNAVRHSACTDATFDLRVEHHTIVMLLSENGHGFDPEQPAGGHGLASMKARAASLGGKLEIDTSVRGTVITLRAPLSGRSLKN